MKNGKNYNKLLYWLYFLIVFKFNCILIAFYHFPQDDLNESIDDALKTARILNRISRKMKTSLQNDLYW